MEEDATTIISVLASIKSDQQGALDMSLAVDLESKLFFSSSTAKPLDMGVIHHLFVAHGFTQTIETAYTHVAEVISNIYEHATFADKNSVNWHMEAEQHKNFVLIDIQDYGTGIFNSINHKHKSSFNPVDAFLYQVSDNGLRDRGHGLRSLISGIDSGQLKHFYIASSGISLFHKHTITAHRSLITTGTKLSLAVTLNEKLQ